MVDELRGKTAKGAATDTTLESSQNQSAADSLRAGREHAVDEAKAMMRDAAESQKKRAADGLGEVAQALHETARHLGPSDSSVTARYADMAAEQVERMAQFLRSSDWKDMAGDAERFARRQPALFLGGAMAAGFVLARFLKSSGEATATRVPKAAEASATSAYSGTGAPSSPYATPPAGDI